MPKRQDIQTILVIGSGPITIGQAAEFDYAGTQACLSLKEEGYQVILVNSNPATIMTDRQIADKVYMEPLTLEFVSKIIRSIASPGSLGPIRCRITRNQTSLHRASGRPPALPSAHAGIGGAGA